MSKEFNVEAARLVGHLLRVEPWLEWHERSREYYEELTAQGDPVGKTTLEIIDQCERRYGKPKPFRDVIEGPDPIQELMPTVWWHMSNPVEDAKNSTVQKWKRRIRSFGLWLTRPTLQASLGEWRRELEDKQDFAKALEVAKKEVLFMEGDGERQSKALLELGELACDLEMLELAEDSLSWAVRLCMSGHYEENIMPRLWLAFSKLYVQKGDKDKARRCQRHAVDVGRRYGCPKIDLSLTLNATGTLWFNEGDYAQTADAYHRAMFTAERVIEGGHQLRGVLLANLATLLSTTGEVEEARRVRGECQRILKPKIWEKIASGAGSVAVQIERRKCTVVDTIAPMPT